MNYKYNTKDDVEKRIESQNQTSSVISRLDRAGAAFIEHASEKVGSGPVFTSPAPAVLSSRREPFFTSEIDVKHPKYQGRPAPLPQGLRPANGEYPERVKNRLAKARGRTKESYYSLTDFMKMTERRFEPFRSFMAESDIEEMKTTCALGMWKPSHTQLDEGRTIGSGFTIPLRNDILETLKVTWSDHLRKSEKSASSDSLQLVLPTGTSLGWPFFFPDDKENVRTFTLAMLALAIQAEKDKGTPLSAIIARLSSDYGPRFIAPGWRYQHTAKQTPIFYDDTKMTWSQNLEPRVRLIAMIGKSEIIYNRIPSKRMIKAALLMPQHRQDRSYIQKVFDRWFADDSLELYAVDVSAFDNSWGGQNLVRMLELYASITGDRAEDFIAEVSAPMLVPHGRDVYMTMDKIAPQLPSGASFTTVVGLLAGDYLVHLMYKIAGVSLQDHLAGRKVQYLNWGDDIVMAVPRGTDMTRVFEMITAETQIVFDREPTLKYLGFVYGSGTLKAHTGYSQARLLIKSIFPETVAAYPFSVIGYAARLQFVQDARRYHDLFTRHLWMDHLGSQFKFDDLKKVLTKALQDSIESDTVPRDTLNFLLHGLNPDDDPSALDMFDFDFTQWVGRSFINMTDPTQAAAEHASELYAYYKRWVPDIQRNGIDPFIQMMALLTGRKKWRGGKNSPLF